MNPAMIPPQATPTHLHATSIDIDGKGILIFGKPGAGKSSLALQLIDRGATLIADDQTLLKYENEKVILHPPEVLQGLMEVRGVGLCSFPFKHQSYLTLCVEICEKDEVERLPEPLFQEYYRIRIPLLKLNRDDPLGPMKVELKLCYKDRSDA